MKRFDEPKVVLKSKIPFKRKKLDLSIYTFDKIVTEKSFEDIILDESPSSYNFKYLSN